MCRQVECRTCGKTTWAGCGQHVEQTLAGVPRSQRCAGHDVAEAPPRRKGLFASLFG